MREFRDFRERVEHYVEPPHLRPQQLRQYIIVLEKLGAVSLVLKVRRIYFPINFPFVDNLIKKKKKSLFSLIRQSATNLSH